MLRLKTVAGPNPYNAGGFTCVFGEDEKVLSAVVKCSNGDILAANDTAYAIRTSFTGKTVTIQVWSASTVGAGPNAYAQLAAGNMAGLTFTVIAQVE